MSHRISRRIRLFPARFNRLIAATAFAACCALASNPSVAGSKIRIGIQRVMGYPGVPVAIAHGYFAAQDLEPELVYFDAAQPTAVAAASGDIDFGIAGISAAFYALAGEGRLRIIASSGFEKPGFHNLALFAANKAFDGGLQSAKDLRGRLVAVTQVGSGLHYMLGLVADGNGVALSSLTIKPLQANGSIVAALRGNAVDAAMMPGTPALQPAQAGAIKLIGWAGDLAPPTLISAVFVAAHVADAQPDLVKRFLAAHRLGLRDYHDAFASAEDQRSDGPTATEVLAIMSRFTELPAEKLAEAIPFVDRDGRISETDISRQIAWHRAQGFLKEPVEAKAIIDARYALAF